MTEFWVFDPSRWPAGSADMAALAAFLWGLGSAFLSPCHLGIIPLMGSHAAGVGPFGQTPERSQPVKQVLGFSFGYFCTVPLLGMAILLLGATLGHVSHYWTIPVGLMLGWFGFDMLRNHACSGATHRLTALGQRLRLGPILGVTVIGFVYGLVSAGCTAGFLVPLMLAALPQGPLFGVAMALCFGIGHCLPMILVGCSAHAAARLYHSHPHDHDHNHQDPHRAERLFRRVMGLILMVVGVVFVLHPFLEH